MAGASDGNVRVHMTAGCLNPGARAAHERSVFGRARWFAVMVAGLSAPLLASTGEAADVSLHDRVERYESTVAWQEALRTWDTHKHYGAERERALNAADYAPDGLRWGSFTLFPSLFLGGSYWNVGGGDPALDYDLYEQGVTATLKVQSDLPRHVIDFLLSGSYLLSEDDNWGEQTEGVAETAFRIDVDALHAIFGTAGTELRHEGRLESELPTAAAEPVAFQRSHARLGLRRDAGRLAATLEAEIEEVDYDDVDAVDGSNIDQDYRDRTEVSGALNLIYRFSPGAAVLTGISIRDIDSRGTGADDRDAIVYGAGVGFKWEVNSAFTTALRLRYEHRDYRLDTFEDFGGLTVEGEIGWRPTHLSQLRLTMKREIAETGVTDASARIDTGARLEGSYEVMRNLHVNAFVGYEEEVFVGADRHDDVLSVGAGLQYSYTKNASIVLSYEHIERQSSDQSLNLESDIVRAGINLAF
ncbi:MAG: outer membrane beta-barrel protein [Rhizobiales bacterium]|nr:outer membrane beta-barrel protein [Hyphomicrobiales bacterium]